MARLLPPAAVVTAIVAVVFVVSAPSADAAAPDWMRPAIDDGRNSIYTNMDTTRQGSPLVFTRARCRGDGALLLFYEHRRLWVAPVTLAAEVPSDWRGEPAPRSFAGGVADGLALDYGEDLAGYFGEHGEIRCPDEPIGAPAVSPSNELADEALRIVRSDARVDELLDRNLFQVDRVAIEGDWVHLLLAFDGPIVGPTPWDITCLASFAGGPITGAHWVIDLETSSVVAHSPLWGENSCPPLPDTT